MPIRIKNILLTLFTLLHCSSLAADQIVSLDKFESPLNVASYAVYVDTILSFDKIKSLPQEHFKKINKTDFGKGFLSKGEVWIKMNISYGGDVDVKRVMTSSFSRIDTISYYLMQDDKILQYKKGGNYINHLHNDYNYNYPLFELSLPPNYKGQLYIQLKPKSYVFFPMEFWEPKALSFHNLTRRFEEGMLIGIISLFFISVLVFASIFKENYFWYYAIYLFSVIIFISHFHGNLWNSLGIETSGLHNVMIDQLVGICFILFTRSFLELQKKYPKANLVINIFIGVGLLSFILQLLLDNLSGSWLGIKSLIDVLAILGTFTYNFFILWIIYLAFKENKLTRYLWIIFSVLIFFVGAIFTNLHLMGIYNPGKFLTDYIPILILLETAVLFAVIAFDYFEIQIKKNQTDKELALEKQNALGNLVRGADQERERVAREIHDGVGGLLVAIKLQFDQFKEKIPKTYADKFSQLLNQSTQEVKNISYNLMPSSLTLTSLKESLEQMVQQYRTENGPAIEFYTPNWNEEFSMEYKLGIYRIVQELLKNTIEHAKASEIIVQISRYGGRVHLIVEDNGIGFDESKVSGGLGMNNIKNRVAFLNGKLEIDSYLNRGTTFNIIINISEDGNIDN